MAAVVETDEKVVEVYDVKNKFFRSIFQRGHAMPFYFERGHFLVKITLVVLSLSVLQNEPGYILANCCIVSYPCKSLNSKRIEMPVLNVL